MAGCVNKRDRPERDSLCPADRTVRTRREGIGTGTVLTPVKCRISVSQANGDTSFYLLTVAIRPRLRKPVDQGGLSMVNVANDSDINARNCYITRNAIKPPYSILNEPTYTNRSCAASPDRVMKLLHKSMKGECLESMIVLKKLYSVT